MADPIDARGAAIWNDGTPANLRAAAMDALDWLDVLQKQAAYIRMPAEDTRRLMACRVALARQIRRPAPASGMAQAAGEGQRAVAYVPVHPRQGPLWANTIPAERVSVADKPSYSLMALYASPAVAPSDQPVRMLTVDECTELLKFGASSYAMALIVISRFCEVNGLSIGAAPSAQEPTK